jgi:hypothetical protein
MLQHCHTNGKLECHTKQTGLVQNVVQTAKTDVGQIRPDNFIGTNDEMMDAF